MKLFDRSVDLAQFDEDSPLYPICRAWIRNQPSNRGLHSRERTPTPEPLPQPSTSQDEEVGKWTSACPCDIDAFVHLTQDHGNVLQMLKAFSLKF